MIDFISTNLSELSIVLILYMFLPLTALTYYVFRRGRRQAEIARIIEILEIKEADRELYYDKRLGFSLLLAVFYASVISIAGLLLLILGREIGFPEFPFVWFGKARFPQFGSKLVFSMAFFGAYLWGLQHVLRRYLMNDLTPGVYYTLSLRMVMAAIIALLVFNAYEALASSSPPGTENMTSIWPGLTFSIWPALAFLIGMFPQRGLHWLTARLPMFSSKAHPAVRDRPLEMIEGITIHDKLRLEELGIDTCFDLADTDFVPLMLNTPYGARELLDWILQAKLCRYLGGVMMDLRQHSIRTVIDLELLNEEDIDALAAETVATKSALIRARNSVKNDSEIKRLCAVVRKLGHFTGIEGNEANPG